MIARALEELFESEPSSLPEEDRTLWLRSACLFAVYGDAPIGSVKLVVKRADALPFR